MEFVALSASSDTDADAATAAPSEFKIVSAGHAPVIPDSASSQLHAIVTGSLYQPLLFAGVVGAPERSGATWSNLTVFLREVEPPALAAVHV